MDLGSDSDRAFDIALSRVLLGLAALAFPLVLLLPRGFIWVSWVLFVALTVAATKVAIRGIPPAKRALPVYLEWQMMAFIAGSVGYLLLRASYWITH